MKDYGELFAGLVQGAFPHIRAQNATGPGAQDGTPYTAELIDDIWGWMQAVMAEAGMAPDGESEGAGFSQLLGALKTIFKDKDWDIGVAAEHLLGLVKSSNEPGKVSVSGTGEMTANGLPELLPDQIAQWGDIENLKARISILENGVFTETASNPFMVTFEDTVGWEMISGIRSQHAIEC